jgi:hypothetical protein
LGGFSAYLSVPSIARRRGERVVPALAVGEPDRVDRRQVDDVEAELGQLRQPVVYALQAAPGAGEELVPGAEAGPQTVDLDHLWLVEADPTVAMLIPLHGGQELLAQGHVVLGAVGSRWILELPAGVLDHLARRLRARLPGRRAQQHDPLGQLAGQIMLAGGHLAPELVPPRPEQVRPGLDRVQPAPGARDREVRRPADPSELGVDPAQLDLLPLRFPGTAIPGHGANQLVAVTKDVRFDVDPIADAALDGVSAAVDGRGGVLDDDPPGGLAGRGVIVWRFGR